MGDKKKVARTCVICGKVDVISYKRDIPDKCRDCSIRARKIAASTANTPVYDYDKPAQELEIQSIDNENIVIIARQNNAETRIKHYKSTIIRAMDKLKEVTLYVISAETYSRAKQPPRIIMIDRNTIITGV